jgi:hypothetical protein
MTRTSRRSAAQFFTDGPGDVSRPVEWNEQSTGKPAIDDPEPSEIPDPAIEFPLGIVLEAPGVAVESGWSPRRKRRRGGAAREVERDGAGRRENGARWRGATRGWNAVARVNARMERWLQRERLVHPCSSTGLCRLRRNGA